MSTKQELSISPKVIGSIIADADGKVFVLTGYSKTRVYLYSRETDEFGIDTNDLVKYTKISNRLDAFLLRELDDVVLADCNFLELNLYYRDAIESLTDSKKTDV